MSAPRSELAPQLATAFQSVCLSELEALKPGNVHIFADGHGMVVQDFVRSAEAAAAAIARPELTVGQRIQSAVEATREAVGCNTNLGIVLLCAPLVHAVLYGTAPTLRACLTQVLQDLTVDDAQRAYQGILRAAPGGLGESARYDVREMPTVTLLEAMREAQARDCIALQYANGFADVFGFGTVRYRETLERWGRPAWAMTAVYLGFMARFADTHIVRKHGAAVAGGVREEAASHEQALLALENPKKYQGTLLRYDADLKARGLNPGTSADLAVASVLAAQLENMVTGLARS